ncbi:MAG TPA: glycosyltransferase family 1 protein [Streptosporangiaceae bacterium]|nr:glycosyltransferase family 1 protein [Streptosporangiaceae bacterium]
MRIGIIAESFPPDVNGVAHSVLRVAEHLVAGGHEPLVIAPQPGRGTAAGTAADSGQLGYPVRRVRSVPLPGYRTFRLGLGSAAIRGWLTEHRAEVVHLASPFVLGARGMVAARQLRLPTVAVYQTDVPGYARAYRLGAAAEDVAWRWVRRIHNAADRTLAPSTASAERLRAHGVQRVWLWGRGVDCQRFSPAHRSDSLRRSLAPRGEVLVGYVGRLANEKRVDLLGPIAGRPGVRLIIVGGGPAEDRLRRQMPAAVFLGQHRGEQLARIFASLDVFVHSGCHETFGQTIQEAAASGLPVVAPAVGGPVDLVEDGVTGSLVRPGDAAALAQAATRLAADPSARAAQGRAARQRVLARSWSAVGDALVGHYAAVLAGGRAGNGEPGQGPGPDRGTAGEALSAA